MELLQLPALSFNLIEKVVVSLDDALFNKIIDFKIYKKLPCTTKLLPWGLTGGIWNLFNNDELRLSAIINEVESAL